MKKIHFTYKRKIVQYFFLIFFLILMLEPLFHSHFAKFCPSNWYQNISLYISISFGFLFFLFTIYQYIKKQIKILNLLVFTIFITYLFWATLESVFPSIFINFISTNFIAKDIGHVDIGNRYDPCGYSYYIALKHHNGPFFGYCISNKTASYLPNKEFPVIIMGRKNKLGIIVDKVKRIEEETTRQQKYEITIRQ